METPKIFEIARYKISEKAWFVLLEPVDFEDDIKKEDQWMKTHHPKVVFERGPYKKLWKTAAHLPRLDKFDFMSLVHILTSNLIVAEFEVVAIARSQDTGEFFYENIEGRWMPESYLFDSKQAAQKEQRRINAMLKKWCDK